MMPPMQTSSLQFIPTPDMRLKEHEVQLCTYLFNHNMDPRL